MPIPIIPSPAQLTAQTLGLPQSSCKRAPPNKLARDWLLGGKTGARDWPAATPITPQAPAPPASFRAAPVPRTPSGEALFLGASASLGPAKPDPNLLKCPEEVPGGETQPFSLQNASCPRRCWCRSGYPHPSLPPFWKHTEGGAPAGGHCACARARAGRGRPLPRASLWHPRPSRGAWPK